MVNDREAALHRLIEQIENGDREVSERDRELLLEFSDRLTLLGSEYSDDRHEKLLRHCTIAAEEVGGLSDALKDREAAEKIVRWIHRSYSNEETNKDYRTALRMFGQHLVESGHDVPSNDDNIPESLEWIPSTTSRDYNPSPDPGEMLDWEDDVKPMIEATLNARDAALIAVAWDAGPRSGELLDLTVGDVSDHKHGLRISVDGKTGQRSVLLQPSIPYLNRWLDDHPRRNDENAPLWCKIESGEEISYQMARKAILQAADKADVNKDVTFTKFRKSSASYLASQGVNQAVLEDHHGWTTGSDAAARYISVFAEASDREIARAHGAEIAEEDESRPTAAIECPRCEKETPRDEQFCMWCHQALEPSAANEIERKQESERRKLLRIAKDQPELLDRLEEMEPLVEALGGDPSIVDTAQKFSEATASDG